MAIDQALFVLASPDVGPIISPDGFSHYLASLGTI